MRLKYINTPKVQQLQAEAFQSWPKHLFNPGDVVVMTDKIDDPNEVAVVLMVVPQFHKYTSTWCKIKTVCGITRNVDETRLSLLARSRDARIPEGQPPRKQGGQIPFHLAVRSAELKHGSSLPKLSVGDVVKVAMSKGNRFGIIHSTFIPDPRGMCYTVDIGSHEFNYVRARESDVTLIRKSNQQST